MVPHKSNVYCTGATTTGSLTSPVIQGVTSSSELSFSYWREVESYQGGFDITQVDVSYDGGSGWTPVWYMDAADGSAPGAELAVIT